MVDSFTIKPGQSLGRYEILSLIARGGMAEVWLARFNGVGGFQKQVVLKTILPHLAEDPEFVRMFINEALLAARLNHPNVVQIFDLGRLEGRYFIAMEHVPGRSFRQISRRRREQGELIPTWFTLRVIAAVCDGLYYAHEYCDEQGNPLGLVHRDVSPENVMVSFTGITKILDFGVAKATTASTVTKAGTLKGKYSYISPEQVRGAPADRRSDIYAIGVILYEFLTGVRPFRGNNDLALLREIARGNPTAPRKIAPWIAEELEHIVLTALALNPDDRYDDAGKLGMDILEYLRKSGDQVSQRDIGLYVSSLFPEEPSIPSDVLKRLVSAQNVEAQLKTPEPSSVASDPAALEPEIIPAEQVKNSKDSGTIEITGLDTWQGDDIPPANHPKGTKPKPQERSASGSFVSVGETVGFPEKATAAKATKAKLPAEVKAPGTVQAKQLSSTDDQDTTQPRGSSGQAAAKPKAAVAAQGGSPTAQKGLELAQPPRAEGAGKSMSEAAKPQAKAAEGNKSAEKKGRGSWLQRIIRREGPKPAAEGKEDSGAEAAASLPAGHHPPPTPRQFSGSAPLDLKPEPIDRVKTEESEAAFEQLASGEVELEEIVESDSQPNPQPVALRTGVTGSVARPKTVGRLPGQEPAGKRVPKAAVKPTGQQAAVPQVAESSKVASPPLTKSSTISKKPSVGTKAAAAPPLARPQTAERTLSSASLPRPATVKSGSSPSLPKPQTVQGAPAGSSSHQPPTTKDAAQAPSPAAEQKAGTAPASAGASPDRLPKSQAAKSAQSPSLPKPSTALGGPAQSLPKPSTTAAGKVASATQAQLPKSVSSPSLVQPSSSKSGGALPRPSTPAKAARLPRPKSAEHSIVSPTLPQPSSIPRPAAVGGKAEDREASPPAAVTEPRAAESSSSVARGRSVFDTAAAPPTEKKANQVADWFNRPPAEGAEEQPSGAKNEKPAGSRDVSDWFTRRPVEEGAEEESGSRELRSPGGKGKPAELDLPSPAGITTRPGGWDSAPRGPADFFGMKRPIVSNDDADVFTSHGPPRGWNPERQTFDDLKSNVSRKTEEDMITRFREMGRQARSLAGLAGQSKAEYVETHRSFSRGANEAPLAADLAAVHFERGLASLRHGDYTGALREWEEALSGDPENRVYLSNMKRLKDLIASLG